MWNPKYIGLTLSWSLIYCNHLNNIPGKLLSRNTFIHILIGTAWGASIKISYIILCSTGWIARISISFMDPIKYNNFKLWCVVFHTLCKWKLLPNPVNIEDFFGSTTQHNKLYRKWVYIVLIVGNIYPINTY